MTIKKVEICPGFGEQDNVITPYSGNKFGDPTTISRNSDPVYDSGEEVQFPEDEEPSEGTPAGVF